MNAWWISCFFESFEFNGLNQWIIPIKPNSNISSFIKLIRSLCNTESYKIPLGPVGGNTHERPYKGLGSLPIYCTMDNNGSNTGNDQSHSGTANNQPGSVSGISGSNQGVSSNEATTIRDEAAVGAREARGYSPVQGSVGHPNDPFPKDRQSIDQRTKERAEIAQALKAPKGDKDLDGRVPNDVVAPLHIALAKYFSEIPTVQSSYDPHSAYYNSNERSELYINGHSYPANYVKNVRKTNND